MALVLAFNYKRYYLVSPSVNLRQVEVIDESEHGLSRRWAIHTGDKREGKGGFCKDYLPILLSTRASILFWKICGVVEEEKLLLVITFSSGFFFLR